MAPSAQAHRRSHSLLLFQKLLNLRDSASPLTLVLDMLEQSGRPVIDEFITRAKVTIPLSLPFPHVMHAHSLTTVQISHAKIIFISFATIKKPSHADIFIKARAKPLQRLRSEIVSHYPAASAGPTGQAAAPQSKPSPPRETQQHRWTS